MSVTAASAGPLITFTDTAPSGSTTGFLGDTTVNWAASWTQTRATTNVSISALLKSNVGVTTSDWYITTAIGPAATAADVVYSGSAVLPTTSVPINYNGAPRTLLADDLDFAAGTYYLVLDGPAGSSLNNAEWTGGASTVALDPAFSLGSYYVANNGNVAAFAPQSNFALYGGTRYVFELIEASPAEVPAPATLPLALALLAAGACAAATRRRRAGPARA